MFIIAILICLLAVGTAYSINLPIKAVKQDQEAFLDEVTKHVNNIKFQQHMDELMRDMIGGVFECAGAIVFAAAKELPLRRQS